MGKLILQCDFSRFLNRPGAPNKSIFWKKKTLLVIYSRKCSISDRHCKDLRTFGFLNMSNKHLSYEVVFKLERLTGCKWIWMIETFNKFEWTCVFLTLYQSCSVILNSFTTLTTCKLPYYMLIFQACTQLDIWDDQTSLRKIHWEISIWCLFMPDHDHHELLVDLENKKNCTVKRKTD